jgi:predicted secreted acid phosphatase
VQDAIATLLTMISLGGGLAPADEPRAPANPPEIVAYRESGEWRADTTRALRRARRVLRRRLDEPKPGIVLDVDDTALSTYACMKAADFDRAQAGCGRRRDLPAIPQTRRLFRFAREHGVAVFFITGRRERMRDVTADNLRRAGYGGWRRLRMRPDDQPARLKDGWKARARRGIERRGYRIVVNVGDQRSDLDGGHAEWAIKLPNPMYVIPDA